MAQTRGEGVNRGRSAGRYGGGRRPKPKPKPKPSVSSANAAEYRLQNKPRAGSANAAEYRLGNASRPAVRPVSRPAYRPPVRAAIPVRPVTPSGGNRNRSGKSVGSNPTGRISATRSVPKPAKPAKKPAKPKYLTPEQWLAGDTTYLGQKKDLASALAAYKNRNQLEGSNYTTNYNVQKKQLDRDRLAAAASLRSDYASRGLLGSSMMGTAETGFTNDWTSRFTDMSNKKNQYTTNLANDLTDFTSTNTAALDKAQQDALQRRLLKYNL